MGVIDITEDGLELSTTRRQPFGKYIQSACIPSMGMTSHGVRPLSNRAAFYTAFHAF